MNVLLVILYFIGCFVVGCVIGRIIIGIYYYVKESNDIREVILRDKWYEFKTDNDELDDPEVYVKVRYNARGKILSRDYYGCFRCGECKNKSSYKDIQTFEITCGLDTERHGLDDCKKYSCYEE